VSASGTLCRLFDRASHHTIATAISGKKHQRVAGEAANQQKPATVTAAITRGVALQNRADSSSGFVFNRARSNTMPKTTTTSAKSPQSQVYCSIGKPAAMSKLVNTYIGWNPTRS